MAPNLTAINSTVAFHCFLLCVSCFTVVNTQEYLHEKEPCYRPRCYHFLRTNSSNVIDIKRNDSTGRTIFCYEGLQQSLIHLWSSPMLKTVKEFPAKGDEVIKFFTYYGPSLSEAEDRSDAPVNALFQNWVSSIQSVKHTEDFALNAFNTSCIVVDSNVNYRATVDLRAIDLWFLFYLGAGMLVFFSARTWSRNTNLHLGTGVSVGVLASILILLYILSRFLPSKLKSLCYVLMAMGTSASIWALQSVSDTMITKLVPYWHYVLGYVVIMGLLSAAVVYRYGKITDTRTLNLIQWLLQCIGLILIYNGTQIREVSVALIIVTLMVYNFPRLWLARYFTNQSSRNLWYRFFPPKIQLLTEEEYNQQGNIHTLEELEKLRDYCRSPDCKAWKVISRLNSPHKFADFIANDAWHISEQEANWYTQDSNSDPTDSDNYSDAESELTFILGNPNMRVTLS